MTGALSEAISTPDGDAGWRRITHQGPLARELEQRAARVFRVRHAVAVANPTFGLILLADCLALSGEVLIPALAPSRCAQALTWAGLRPVFCDVDPGTLAMTAETAAVCAGPETSGILGAAGADEAGLAAFAAAATLTYFQDGLGANLGASVLDLPVRGDPAGLAIVVTEDDGVAARLRSIRASYDAGHVVPVMRSATGRVTEAQAGLALPALDGLGSVTKQRAAYRAGLPGRRLLPIGRAEGLVLDDAADRERILAELAQHGVPARAPMLDGRAAACVIAAGVAARTVLLPLGPTIEPARICALLRRIG